MTGNPIQARFDVSPRIIKILGEELIHDKKIAIAELVKNAYDADSTKVIVTVSSDEIIIEDDGIGMNADIIENFWLKPGSSKKRNSTERTPKFQRLPLGEKGVGRLGVHRLGNHIKVISKMSESKEFVFEINWNEIENEHSLQDLNPISIVENDPPIEFKEKTGTKLVIQKLRECFGEKDIIDLQKDLLKIISPFQTGEPPFTIELHTKLGLFTKTEALNLEHVLKQALFSFDIRFERDEIIQFTYNCLSPNNALHPSRTLILSNPEVQYIIDNTKKHIDTNNSTIDLGIIVFRGYIFEPKLSKTLGFSLDKKIREYLQENGGIRVYRDGIRVYNYGEDGKDNDILNLDRKRAKKLGDNIGYNQILAAIELDYETSRSLKEKTNREGFIHNEEFSYLQQQLDFCMDIVTNCRKLDKAELKILEGRAYDRADVSTKIKQMISQINKLPIEKLEKQKLNNNLYEFSKQFEEVKSIFLTAANTGLNLTFIVHEIDKIIDHLEQTIKNKNLDDIECTFQYLKNSIASYKDTIHMDKKNSLMPITPIIEQALFNSEYRFNFHKIEIIKNIQEKNIEITCKKGLVIGVLNNLFDNAIYWLDYYKTKNKKILIRTYSETNHNIILIADNGKGFLISFEAALGPFITGRIDETSMGIGLHLAKQIMEAHQGSIEHSDWQTENLPIEFEKGAIIKLIFPKEIK